MEKMCKNCGTPIAKEYCEGYPEVCEHWTPKKPKTNADSIKEKLAEILSGMCKIAEQCDFCPMDGNCPGGSYDLSEWYEWLKQPAEE